MQKYQDAGSGTPSWGWPWRSEWVPLLKWPPRLVSSAAISHQQWAGDLVYFARSSSFPCNCQQFSSILTCTQKRIPHLKTRNCLVLRDFNPEFIFLRVKIPFKNQILSCFKAQQLEKGWKNDWRTLVAWTPPSLFQAGPSCSPGQLAVL